MASEGQWQGSSYAQIPTQPQPTLPLAQPPFCTTLTTDRTVIHLTLYLLPVPTLHANTTHSPPALRPQVHAQLLPTKKKPKEVRPGPGTPASLAIRLMALPNTVETAYSASPVCREKQEAF